MLTALAMTSEQLTVLTKADGIRAVYANCAIFWGNDFEKQVQIWIVQMKKQGKKAYLSLPYILRKGDLEPVMSSFLRLITFGLAGFLVHDIEGFALLKNMSLTPFMVGDYQLYTYNREAQLFWKDHGLCYDTISPELNASEIARRDNSTSEMIIYGYTMMMISAQCVKKNLDHCDHKYGLAMLKDRYQKNFRVKCECDFCYNIIYNSIPLGLLKEANQVKKLGPRSCRLSFSTEDTLKTQAMVQLFTDVYIYKKSPTSGQAFTRGHFRRGIE